MGNFMSTCEQLGRRRLEIAEQCRSKEDWEANWPTARHPYAFEWGTCWRAVTEFAVASFDAEVGFYADMLGFAVNATWEDHVMLMTPDRAYAFTIARPGDGLHADPRSLNLQFMLANVKEATAELKRRGVVFLSELKPEGGPTSPMRTSTFRSPSGYQITLWGLVEVAPT